SHPRLLPVMSARWRMASSRVTRGSILRSTRLPFTVSVTETSPGPTVRTGTCASASLTPTTPAARLPTPVDLRNVPRLTPRRSAVSCVSCVEGMAESRLTGRSGPKDNQKSLSVYRVLRSVNFVRLREVQHVEELLQRFELVFGGIDDGAPLLQARLRPVFVFEAGPAVLRDFDDDRTHGGDVELHR